MTREFINPESLFPSLQHGFSQAVAASGRRTVYISGQTAWNSGKQLVGGNLGDQARQALTNVELAVEAAGGCLADVVSLRIYIVGYTREQAGAVSGALKQFFPGEQRPASTWLGVACLADPDFMIEIEATAVLAD